MSLGNSLNSKPSAVVKEYSLFERLQGGVLLVLQGSLLLGQSLVVPYVPMGEAWSPAYLLPLFLFYFVIRGPVWRAVYRKKGHLDSQMGKNSAKLYMYMVTAGLPVFMVLAWSKRAYMMGVPVVMGIAWSLGLWLVVTLLGMLPVDYLFYYGHWLILDRILRAEPVPVDWVSASAYMIRVVAVGLITVGSYQHSKFRRLNEGAGDPS